MNSTQFRVRRATVDDLDALKTLWASMRLPADELEKRLTEFQIVETDDCPLVGAIGVQIAKQHALLHSEGYTDFSAADTARDLFWQRIQTLASNHGVFRLWTQERSPFWKNFGFQPVGSENLPRLPEPWKNEFEGGWLTIQLKDEDKIAAALEKEFTLFSQTEKQHNARILDRARTLKTIITVVGFTVGILGIAFAAYLLLRRGEISMPH